MTKIPDSAVAHGVILEINNSSPICFRSFLSWRNDGFSVQSVNYPTDCIIYPRKINFQLEVGSTICIRNMTIEDNIVHGDVENSEPLGWGKGFGFAN